MQENFEGFFAGFGKRVNPVNSSVLSKIAQYSVLTRY